MNLYFRLILTLLRCLWLPAISPGDTLTVRRRVLPTDLDINVHMNSSRYQSVAELSMLEFFVRTGLMREMMRRGWRPMAGSIITTFRHQLRPFQRYELRFRWVCCDERFNFMAWEYISDSRVCAAGYLKGGVVSKEGIVSPSRFPELAKPSERELFSHLVKRPMPLDVAQWREAEQTMIDLARERVSGA